MALPVILVDSTTGSDSLASGAGPATAITGSAGVSASTTITLDGSPDLSGLLADGSEVIYFADATAGNLNFSKITNKDNSLKTVTVAVAFTAGTKAWAIGGKRANIGSTTSSKLIENNSANGDALPGWAIQMASGHNETISNTLTCRRAGDTTTGPIEIRGIAGAATRPLLKTNSDADGFDATAAFWSFRDFEMQQTSTSSPSAAIGIKVTGVPVTIRNVKMNHATNKWWKGVTLANKTVVRDCEIGNTISVGITGGAVTGVVVENNWIHDVGSHGIASTSGGGSGLIKDNLIYNAATDGINLVTTTASAAASWNIINNTIDKSGSDAIEMTGAATQMQSNCIFDNVLSNSTGYALNFSNASATAVYIAASGLLISGNTFYTNGGANNSGKYNVALTNSENEQTANPGYSSVSTGNAMIGTALKATGYPVGGAVPVGTTSPTYSYVDPGCAQRQEPAAGGVILVSLTGGCNG